MGLVLRVQAFLGIVNDMGWSRGVKRFASGRQNLRKLFFGVEKLILLGALFSVHAQLFDFHLELKAATSKLTPPVCQGGRGIN